jgi:hypothetical protein
VIEVALDIDAFTRTICKSRWAGAVATSADLTIDTFCAADTAIIYIAIEVGTGSATFVLSGGTRQQA